MRAVSLIQDDHPQFIDHLVPISAALEIPLLFTSGKEWKLAKKFYPYSHLKLVSSSDITPEVLAEKYDCIVSSDYWSKERFHQIFGNAEALHGKRMYNIHCPHGFSDKVFWFEKNVDCEVLFVYGQNMLDLLRSAGVTKLGPHLITGNYRYTYYQEHRAFFTKVVEDTLSQHLDSTKKTILYAPTWFDQEQGGTFFDYLTVLVEQLPEEYNLIVKPHPLLEMNDLVQYHRLAGVVSRKENAYFLEEFPLIYPLLEKVDIYIGDMSSVGYDFLAWNRPLFFFNKLKRDAKTDRNAFLYRCGVEVLPEEVPQIYEIIKAHLSEDKERFSAIRKEVYQYTFGKPRPFSEILQEAEELCSGSIPLSE